MSLEHGDPPDPPRRVPFLPCDLDHLPLWTVDVEFKGAAAGSVRMEERFQDLEVGTGPAELVSAAATMMAFQPQKLNQLSASLNIRALQSRCSE